MRYRTKRRYDDVIRQFDYPSKSNPSRDPYKCIIQRNGNISCNCPGWCTNTYETPEDENERPAGRSQSTGKLIYRRCRHTRDAQAALKMIKDVSTEVGFSVDI